MHVELGEEFMVMNRDLFSSFRRGDLRVFVMGLLIWGTAPGMLFGVCCWCVCGFAWRVCGAVEFVIVMIGGSPATL